MPSTLTICRHLVDWRIRADCSGPITRHSDKGRPDRASCRKQPFRPIIRINLVKTPLPATSSNRDEKVGVKTRGGRRPTECDIVGSRRQCETTGVYRQCSNGYRARCCDAFRMRRHALTIAQLEFAARLTEWYPT